VDIVELVFGKGPFFVDVIDFESAVERDEVGLDGREINADDLGGRMEVCHVTVCFSTNAFIQTLG